MEGTCDGGWTVNQLGRLTPGSYPHYVKFLIPFFVGGYCQVFLFTRLSLLSSMGFVLFICTRLYIYISISLSSLRNASYIVTIFTSKYALRVYIYLGLWL
jgi:hypothetical protein